MMKTRTPMVVMSAMALAITSASAGDLDVVGNLAVSSNLTAHAVTLGGETRTNWPSGGAAASGAADLTAAVLDFSESGNLFRFTLTNNVVWGFTNHVAGREVTLRLAQDATGGWTNTWPTDLLWPGGQRVNAATSANHFDLFKIVDDGEHWLALAQGTDYRIPCVTNCSYALEFDSQNYVQTASATAWHPTDGIVTIEFWIKTDFDGSHGSWPVGTALPDHTRGGWMFWIGDGSEAKVAFNHDHPDWGEGSGDAFVWTDHSSTAIGDNQWHHIAGSYDGSTARLFIDGVLEASQSVTGTFTAWNRPLTVSGPDGYRMAMQIDELRWSTVCRYTSNFTPAHSFTVDSDTVAYYKFNEGDGTTAHDETSNHDLTLQGSPLPTWVEGN